MGVNLHMKLGNKSFNLGRSYKYIDCRESTVDIDLENLYIKKQDAVDEIERRIIAMAAHHPTKAELDELRDDIAGLVSGYADEMEVIGRCMTLAELKENDEKIEFEVE